MKRPKAVIYDCDGVLFDSRHANEVFYNHILQRFGMPPMDPELVDFAHAGTSRDVVDRLFQSSPVREQAQAYRESVDYGPFLALMRPEPHLHEVLDQVHARYRTAIATNRSNTMASVLRRHGLEGLFDMVVTSLDVSHPKPHPESLWKVLNAFGIGPDEALYIGDTEVDQLLARGTGVAFIAYKSPDLDADLHIEDHREILRLLNET